MPEIRYFCCLLDYFTALLIDFCSAYPLEILKFAGVVPFFVKKMFLVQLIVEDNFFGN